MSLESPLGKFLGHGSARSGTEHWWAQRVTSVALLPLTIWFAVSLLGISDFGHISVVGWMSDPVNSILLALLLIAVLYHSQLGLQVVVEDYVHTGWLKVSILVGLQLVHVALGVAGLYSVIVISLSGGTAA
jgi:succinate dehydrogenase / fumarate reductase membrane anchor subunit